MAARRPRLLNLKLLKISERKVYCSNKNKGRAIKARPKCTEIQFPAKRRKELFLFPVFRIAHRLTDCTTLDVKAGA